MNTLPEMTYFCTLNKEQGNITIKKYYDIIRNGMLSQQIRQIRRLTASGDKKQASELKKRLPSVTIAALFKGGRTKKYFVGLTGMSGLDIDNIDADKLEDYKARILADKHTLAVNVSAGGKGLRVIVRYMPQNGIMPAEWDECNRLYLLAYEMAVSHYTSLLGCAIDTSGKDLPRLSFLSHDENIYLNVRAQPFYIVFHEKTTAVNDEACHQGNKDKEYESSMPDNENKDSNNNNSNNDNEDDANRNSLVNKQFLDMLCRPEKPSYERRVSLFRIICKNLYREGWMFVAGNRNNFLYNAISKLNAYGIPYTLTLQIITDNQKWLCGIDEETEPLDEEEIQAIAKSVYEKQNDNFAKKRVPAVIARHLLLKVEIKRLFIMRFNKLSLRPEYIPRRKHEKGKRTYKEVDDFFVNNISNGMREMNNAVKTFEIREIIESDFLPSFDPVKDYLDHTPQWDGIDHIGNLAASVRCSMSEHFDKVLKMFYVGMIANYFDPIKTNNIMPIIYHGSQGGGKSTFTYKLLPPEWDNAMYCGEVKDTTDYLNFIVTKILICVDEIDQMKREDYKKLQELITRPRIDYREPYGHYNHSYSHRASFIGTCNRTDFLNGEAGNRRNPVFEALSFDRKYVIDYPQLYAQVQHLWHSGFRYWFEPEEVEYLDACNHQYQYNTDEYEYILKYVRKYPVRCRKKEHHTVNEILSWIMRYEKNLIVVDRGTKSKTSNALAREKYDFLSRHNGKLYCCYLLTPEQVAYVEEARNPDVMLDVEYDKYVPREVLIAGENATIRDMRKAKELLDSTNGSMEKASTMYSDYITKDKDIYFTKDGELPF